MNKNRSKAILLLLTLLFSFLLEACREKESASGTGGDPKVEKLKLLPGFKAEHLYSPSAHEQGSWVAMTFDHKGRMITADQYGALYRTILPPIGDTIGLKVEKLIIGSAADRNADTTTLKIGMGYAQGLLYAFNSLYVMVNHNSDKDFDKDTGLYRLQDTDGDDQFDKITLLKALKGEPGEHGPHSLVLAPDKKSIYLTAGNHVDVPAMDVYRVPPVWQEDNLFPQIKDPRGHANSRKAPGGWIAHIDSLGERWELVSAGYRNEFDLAFNDAGDLFTYDSDMEWDFGMPWYRPTRICHVTSASEYGWRTGNGKWSPDYPDNLPPVLNIGQGSPTNLISVANANFPQQFKKGLFAFDWSFGIIYAIHLESQGASYSATAEEFLSGSPLPLTDGAIGPDGALYFLTGGRRLESDLYRVYYSDAQLNNGGTAANGNLVAAEINDVNKLRRTLEQYHEQKSGAVEAAWPYLKHEDRFVRFAARLAVEHQPVSEWKERALKENDPVILTQAMIALARHGNISFKNSMLQALIAIDYSALSPAQQIDLLRAFELILYRMGNPEGEMRNKVIAFLNPHYPAQTNDLNRSLSKVLVFLEAPGVVAKTLKLLADAQDDPLDKTVSASNDLIMRNPQYGLDIAAMLSKVPPRQQTYYATVLSEAETGWTPELREQYFMWFDKAFTFQGGRSYIGFIDKARKGALAHVPKDKYDFYNKLSGDSLLTASGNDLANLPSPEGPGRRWTMEEAMPLLSDGLTNRNFEEGKKMFAAALCSSCHMMQGEGGSIGPDLTQLGTRFTEKDILDHTINPSKEVSDQYAATIFSMKDGSSVLGRLTNEDDEKFYISQNPFAPQVLRAIPKDEVISTKQSQVSLMLPGLINRLNEEELKNLLAYLVAGGNKDDRVFSGDGATSTK